MLNAWDPAKDEADGEQCRSYGAPDIMRIPERLHLTWQNDQTLTLETDAGMQTRAFYFGDPVGSGGDWQGVSEASWEFLPAPEVSTNGAHDVFVGREVDQRAGSLKVVTSRLKPGYLRKNGVPYSGKTILTEYFDRMSEPNADAYLIVTAKVKDPTYFNVPFVVGTTLGNKRMHADGIPQGARQGQYTRA